MPYIITTTTGPHMIDHGPHRGHETMGVKDRTTVATLDEAREIVSRIVTQSHPNIPHGLGALAEPGIIGPLPDGTMIEVRLA